MSLEPNTRSSIISEQHNLFRATSPVALGLIIREIQSPPNPERRICRNLYPFITGGMASIKKFGEGWLDKSGTIWLKTSRRSIRHVPRLEDKGFVSLRGYPPLRLSQTPHRTPGFKAFLCYVALLYGFVAFLFEGIGKPLRTLVCFI